MSTPSTATTTIPAHHSQYGYAQHNPCSASSSSYPANNSVPTPRLTASYHTFPATNSNPSYTRNQRSPQSSKQPSHAASMATSQSASARPRNQKKPDWEEFYKNGIPKEIIVIDDDSPPPKPPPRTASRRGGKAAAAGSTQSMAGRKRKVDQGYDTGYHDSPAFSTHPARFGENSSDLSISTDRTTSLQTTAPTSLGSYGSSGASNSYEDVTIGQKRKRTQPQATTRAQTKRKAQDDAFAVYVPPPKPPLKAPEVHVPVVHDVSCLHFAVLQLLMYSQYLPKHQKVDDEDGHYIVTPDTDLTDRCKHPTHKIQQISSANPMADSIVRLLGQGTFGKVVEAFDKKRKTKCAVKIIRSVQKYRDASRIELRVLSTLSLNDKTNRNKCIHLRDSFDFRNHICIVTDLLGQSVFDFLKGNGFVPFPSSQIQSFARQLFTSVACKYASTLLPGHHLQVL